MSPLCEATSPPTASARWSRSSAPRAHLRALSARPARGVRHPRRDLHRVRLLLLLLRLLGRPRARYVKTAIDRFGLDRDSLVVEIASNDGYLLQHVVDAGHPGARGRARRERRRGRRANAGSTTLVGFFGRDRRRSSSPRAGTPTCWSPTTSSLTCPTSTTSPAGCDCCWRPRAWSTLEFPHLAAADRGEPVRHDLPRALLLLLLPHRDHGLRGARARGLRRRGARRTAARFASTRSTRAISRRSRPRSAKRRGARTGAGIRQARGPTRTSRRG